LRGREERRERRGGRGEGRAKRVDEGKRVTG
jgi:hypothetical protein